MLVAVIDSGVQASHPHILPDRLLPGFAVLRDGSIERGDGAASDRLGHGTAVIAAIQEKAAEARILPIRVFHEALAASARALVAAIALAGEAGADLVNLSLGSTNPAHAGHFAQALEACPARIVAPCTDAQGAECWPGALAAAIAVGLDWDVPRDRFRREGRILYASGYPRPIPGVPQRRNLHGISFATAQITGLIAAGVIAVS